MVPLHTASTLPLPVPERPLDVEHGGYAVHPGAVGGVEPDDVSGHPASNALSEWGGGPKPLRGGEGGAPSLCKKKIRPKKFSRKKLGLENCQGPKNRVFAHYLIIRIFYYLKNRSPKFFIFSGVLHQKKRVVRVDVCFCSMRICVFVNTCWVCISTHMHIYPPERVCIVCACASCVCRLCVMCLACIMCVCFYCVCFGGGACVACTQTRTRAHTHSLMSTTPCMDRLRYIKHTKPTQAQ